MIVPFLDRWMHCENANSSMGADAVVGEAQVVFHSRYYRGVATALESTIIRAAKCADRSAHCCSLLGLYTLLSVLCSQIPAHNPS